MHKGHLESFVLVSPAWSAADMRTEVAILAEPRPGLAGEAEQMNPWDTEDR